jgi:small-conductance mechanosensitive channel/CRP-like cAMP-binding protein
MQHRSAKNSHTLKPLFAPVLLVAGALSLQAAVNVVGDASANMDIARQMPTVAAILLYLGWPLDIARQLPILVTILLYLSWPFLLIRLIDVVVWNKLMRAHNYVTPPLLRDIVAVIIWYLVGCMIFSLVLGQSLLHVMTASTVALGLIGFALQKPILDAFSGIVLALQRPFQAGDWLMMGDKPREIGRITEMNWRAVHLVTADEITFIVPNSELLSHRVKIYSQPKQFFRDEIQVTLPYGVTTHQGERILLGAANQVEEIAAIPCKSIVSIVDYTDRGVLWSLLYWCPDAGRMPVFHYQVHQNILRNLLYVGIEVPVPILDLRRVPSKPDEAEEMRGIDPLVQRVSIFAAMTAEELRQISSLTKNRLVSTGTPLLQQGDPGDSLFILRDGLLEVRIAADSQPEIVVGRINPGSFFGERSLLLGEPRSASIIPVVDSTVAEIPREAMVQLMRGRPELAVYLGEVLTERQIKSAAKLASSHHIVEQTPSLFDQMVNRIRSFLGEG